MRQTRPSPASRAKKKAEVPLVCSSAAEYLTSINYHLKKVFADSELAEGSVIRNFRITAADGKAHSTLAEAHALSEFEKYRIVQDRLFESDFDRMLKQLPPEADAS
jgi:hypothetical protein